MKYFFDTEFIESGPDRPIELISLGIAAEDGREFYVENSRVDLGWAIGLSPWLRENVVRHLTWPELDGVRDEIAEKGTHLLRPHRLIGQEVLKFLGMDQKPIFWAYFSDYDWVVLCQLFGSMVALPPTFPRYCRDLKQEMARLGISKPTITGCGPAHNALSDARWGKGLYEYMKMKGMVEF